MKSGVYIVQYSQNTIKIGRSKDIFKRLKSYKGYTSHGQDVQKLLLVFCEQDKNLEKWSHQYAIIRKLNRINKCEVFETDDIDGFIDQFKQDVVLSFGESVVLQDSFEKQQQYMCPDTSNVGDHKNIKKQYQKLEEISQTINQKKSSPITNPYKNNQVTTGHLSSTMQYLEQYRYGFKGQIYKPEVLQIVTQTDQVNISE